MAYQDIQNSVSGLLNRRDATTTQVQSWIQMAIVRIQRELRVPAMEKAVIVTVVYPSASFTGSVAGNTLTVTAGSVYLNQQISDATGQISGTPTITELLSGTLGGAGTYTIDGAPQTVASESMTCGAPFPGIAIPTDFLELIDLIPISDTFDQIRLEKKDLTRALQASAIVGFPEIYARQGGYWIIGPCPAVNSQIQIDYYAEFTPLVNPTDSNILTTVMSDLVTYGALSFAGDFFVDKRASGWEARYTQILNQLNSMAQDDDDQGAATVVPAYSIPDEHSYIGPWNWIP